jgi:hypothetical protein
VRLGTNILIAALRRPVVLAKELVREGDAVDLDRTLQATRPLVEAGATDFRVRWGSSGDPAADEGHLTALVRAFRNAF